MAGALRPLRQPAVLALLAVSLVPSAAGLTAALLSGLDMGSLSRILQTPGVGLSIASSVWTGVAATALSLVLAHAVVASAVTGNWRTRLKACALPLLAMPHLAIGIGLVLVLAPSGLLMRLASPGLTGLTQPPDWFSVQDPYGLSLIVGLVVKETAFLVLILFAALSQVPAERLMLQSRSLGYGRLKGWAIAVAPLLQQQIRLPLLAVLVFGVTNVEMAIPLGPGLPPTFAVLLLEWFADPDPSVNAQAYTGSLLLLMVAVLAATVAAGAGPGFRALWGCSARSGTRRASEALPRKAANLGVLAFWALGMLGVVAVIFRASGGVWRFPDVLPSGAGSTAWLLDLWSTRDVLGTTVLLAVLTALVAVALVLPAAERLHRHQAAGRIVATLLFLPLLLPQITFLFGIQVMLAGMKLDGTLLAVLWTHLIFALPYAWGMLAPARNAIDGRYRDIARSLGAGPVRVWTRVTAPLLLRASVLAMALAASVSVALYLPTRFAGAGRIATAATEAAAAASSGTMRLAALHALQLAVIPLAAFAAAYVVHGFAFANRREVP